MSQGIGLARGLRSNRRDRRGRCPCWLVRLSSINKAVIRDGLFRQVVDFLVFEEAVWLSASTFPGAATPPAWSSR